MKAKTIAGVALSGRRGNNVFVVRGNTAYVRRYTRPKDPQTDDQRAQRIRFSDAIAAWRALPDGDKERYRARAKKMGRSGYNLFMGEFMATARLQNK